MQRKKTKKNYYFDNYFNLYILYLLNNSLAYTSISMTNSVYNKST